MVKIMLNTIVAVLAQLLTPDNMKLFADKMLDWAEDFIASTDNQIDDALVLPVIKGIRTTFNIPDNDEPAAELAETTPPQP